MNFFKRQYTCSCVGFPTSSFRSFSIVTAKTKYALANGIPKELWNKIKVI